MSNLTKREKIILGISVSFLFLIIIGSTVGFIVMNNYNRGFNVLTENFDYLAYDSETGKNVKGLCVQSTQGIIVTFDSHLENLVVVILTKGTTSITFAKAEIIDQNGSYLRLDYILDYSNYMVYFSISLMETISAELIDLEIQY